MRRAVVIIIPLLLFACKVVGAGNPKVVLETNLGNIEVEVFADKAPGTAKNFLSYVDKGFYDGLVFHRVIPNFMVQGGGFSADLKQKTPDGMIKNEANNGLKNTVGTLAMARTSAPDSATSQFFINLKANTNLDHRSMNQAGMGYCVFAKVIKGMEVVNKIAAVKRQCPSGSREPCKLPRGMRDVPIEPVIIKKAKRG